MVKYFLSIRLAILLLSISACNNQEESTLFSVQNNEMDEPLRSLLDSIVQNGQAFYPDAGCRGDGSSMSKTERLYSRFNQLTFKNIDDLQKLTNSVHPIVRSFALVSIMRLPGVKKIPFIQKHINDTAIVFSDYSGQPFTVLSIMLINSQFWWNLEEKKAAEKMVLLQRPFEYASYFLVYPERKLDTFPGFYTQVRAMAAHLLDYQNEGSHINWPLGMASVNRLASYQKKEDEPLIRELLFESLRDREQDEFLPKYILTNFPNSTYDDVLLDTSNYPRILYRLLRAASLKSPGDETGMWDALELIVANKSKRSAALLENLLIRSPYFYGGSGGYPYLKEKEEEFYLKLSVMLRENDCIYYKKLLQNTATWYANHLAIEATRNTQYLTLEPVEPLQSYNFPSHPEFIRRRWHDDNN